MTERDEQGFVKDIDTVINTIELEEKSVPEKVYEILNLPFSVEDVLKVENFVIKETNSNVDIRDDLYKLAILNEQLNGFDDMFKSKLEERHNEKVNEIVEALNVRMEGVRNMYDENLVNVQPVIPAVEQPVVTPTPQLTAINPETPIETVEVGVAQPFAPVAEAPVVDPTQFAAPTSYGEIPAMEPAFSPDLTVPTVETPVVENVAVPAPEMYQAPVIEEPVMVAPVAETPVMEVPTPVAPVVETPVMEVPAPVAPVAETPVMEVPAPVTPVVETPVMEVPAPVTPVVEAPVMEVPAPVAPVVETPVMETPIEVAPVVETPAEEYEDTAFVDFLNSHDFDLPEDNIAPEEENNDFINFINNLPADAYVEPEKKEEVVEEVNDEAAEEPVVTEKNDEEDEEVREIINHFDRLKELKIKIHKNEVRLAELNREVELVEKNLNNDQEEYKRLVA